MKLPRYRTAILVGLGLGAAMPTYYFIRHALDWRYGIGSHEIFLWPSCIWLGAMIGREDAFESYVTIALSIAANMLLYALAACMLLLFLRFIFGRGTRTV